MKKNRFLFTYYHIPNLYEFYYIITLKTKNVYNIFISCINLYARLYISVVRTHVIYFLICAPLSTRFYYIRNRELKLGTHTHTLRINILYFLHMANGKCHFQAYFSRVSRGPLPTSPPMREGGFPPPPSRIKTRKNIIRRAEQSEKIRIFHFCPV